MVRLYDENHNEVVGNIKEWRGRFLILSVNEEPVFVSVHNGPKITEHYGCLVAFEHDTGLETDHGLYMGSEVTFGGGYCSLKDGVLGLRGSSGTYGKFSVDTIGQLADELLDKFGVETIETEE